jgi:hypothetical protein
LLKLIKEFNEIETEMAITFAIEEIGCFAEAERLKRARRVP